MNWLHKIGWSMRDNLPWLLAGVLGGLLGVMVFGCRSIHAEKHADGSWQADYHSWGLFTDLGYLSIDVSTNGVAKLTLNDLTTDMSTNHIAIISASGDFTGEIAEHVIQGIK